MENSLLRSLTHPGAHGKEGFVYELYASISYHFNPEWSHSKNSRMPSDFLCWMEIGCDREKEKEKNDDIRSFRAEVSESSKSISSFVKTRLYSVFNSLFWLLKNPLCALFLYFIKTGHDGKMTQGRCIVSRNDMKSTLSFHRQKPVSPWARERARELGRSGAGEWASERADEWAKQTERSERASERTSERPRTLNIDFIVILLHCSLAENWRKDNNVLNV